MHRLKLRLPLFLIWVSVLVEAGAAQDTGSCMPLTIKIQYHKWEGSRFTSGLLHNITLVKVEEVRLTGWTLCYVEIN